MTRSALGLGTSVRVILTSCALSARFGPLVATTVLLQQLEGRVVLCSGLELLDGLGALGLLVLEAGFQGIDAMGEVSVGQCANEIDDDRSSSHACPLKGAEILPAHDQHEHDGIDEVGETEVKGVENAHATRVCADAIEAGL